jgi:Arc/MetJ family transcription regulator
MCLAKIYEEAGLMRRTTVVIDERLLEEAQKVLGTKGIRDTIEAGLREAVRRGRLMELRRSLGTFDLELTPEELARLRDER